MGVLPFAAAGAAAAPFVDAPFAALSGCVICCAKTARNRSGYTVLFLHPNLHKLCKKERAKELPRAAKRCAKR